MGAGAIQDSAVVDRESLVDREPHGLVFAEHEYDPVVLSEDRLAPRPHGPRHVPAGAQDLVALREHRRAPVGGNLIGSGVHRELIGRLLVLRDRHVPTPPATLTLSVAPQSASAKYARAAGGPTVVQVSRSSGGSVGGGRTRRGRPASPPRLSHGRHRQSRRRRNWPNSAGFDADLYRLHPRSLRTRTPSASAVPRTSGPASCGAG